jgi:hypothetical protein
MKKLTVVAVAVLMVFGVAGVAGALPGVWTDVYDPEPNIYFGANGLQQHSFVHDITDDGFDLFPVDVVTSATLSLNLYDDRFDGRRWYEEVFIDLPGWSADTTYNFFGSLDDIGVSFAGLVQLNAIGQLSVTVERTWGDFFLGDSTLTAYGIEADPVPDPVPEPGTVLLLGSGILGLIALKRKRRS